jgi:hypothetical protein
MLPNQDVPAGWPRPKRSARRVFSAVFLTLTALVIALAAIIVGLAGDVLPALGFAVGALLVGHVAGMSISMLRAPRPASGPPSTGVTDQGEPGIAFPYAWMSYYWLTATLVLIVLGAIGFAIAMAMTNTPRGWVLAAIAVLCAAFIAWFLFTVVRLAPGTIVLTPTGIYHRSLVLEQFVPWDAVVDVVAREGRTPWITVKAMPTSGMRERRHMGRLGAFESQFLPFMVARTMWLGANALPAYRALRHYFEHADERPRLAETVRRASNTIKE